MHQMGGTSQHLAKHSSIDKALTSFPLWYSQKPLVIEQCAISCSWHEVVASIDIGQQCYGMNSQQ